MLQMSEKMEQSEKQAEEGLVDEAQALLAEVGDVDPHSSMECRVDVVRASNCLNRPVKQLLHDARCTRRLTMRALNTVTGIKTLAGGPNADV